MKNLIENFDKGQEYKNRQVGIKKKCLDRIEEVEEEEFDLGVQSRV